MPVSITAAARTGADDRVAPSSRRAAWDLQTVTYDPERYPFLGWVRSAIRGLGYPVAELDRLHDHIDPSRAASLCRRLGQSTESGAFSEIYRAFVREVIQPLVDGEVAAQRLVNFRIHLPRQPGMNIPFHTDAWYGHGLGERNVWLPLAGAQDSASLQIIDAARSRRLLTSAASRRLELAQMQTEFLPYSQPANLCNGEALLFSPLHLHGNVTNDTGRTRVSLDFRVATAGCELNKKWIGGYFRLLRDADDDGAAGGWERPGAVAEPCTSYVNNGTAYTRFIPIHLQRMMIRAPCGAGFLARGLRVAGDRGHAPPAYAAAHPEGRPPRCVVLFSIYSCRLPGS